LKTSFFNAQGRPSEISQFPGEGRAGRHFSPPTQALVPEKCAKPTYTPSVLIEQVIPQTFVDRL